MWTLGDSGSLGMRSEVVNVRRATTGVVIRGRKGVIRLGIRRVVANMILDIQDGLME